MPSRVQLSLPTNAALPHTHRLPSASPEALRALSRLSRASLIDLALTWLTKQNRSLCAPYLSVRHEDKSEEDDEQPYEAAQTIEELEEIYEELRKRKGGRKEVVERVLEGDWRQGITMYQFAMAESRYLLDHPTSLRWNALRLSRVGNATNPDTDAIHESSEANLPRFHAQTFLLSLLRQIAPLTKAHYYLTRIKRLPLTLLRLYIHESPYNTQKSLQDRSPGEHVSSENSKSIFVVFPDGSPFIYISLATNQGQTIGTEGRSLRKIVIEGIPKALSRPGARYELKTTSLSARSLHTLLSLRGPGRSSFALGGWSIFAESSFDSSALGCVSDHQQEQAKGEEDGDKENTAPNASSARKRSKPSSRISSPGWKRRKEVAESRFGRSAREQDGKGLDRLDIRIDDPFPETESSNDRNEEQRDDDGELIAGTGKGVVARCGRKSRPSLLDVPGGECDHGSGEWRPDVRFSFQGPHIFAGVRQLVEHGVVDGETMPAWMTGEAGVSIGVVRHGRMVDKDGMGV